MPYVLIFIGAALGAAGLALGVVGVVVAVDGTSTTGGVVFVACGTLIVYGAYLFARAGVRIRRSLRAEPIGAAEKKERRNRSRGILLYGAVVIISCLVLPLAGVIRVIGVFSTLAVIALLFAVEFEPRKNSKTKTSKTDRES